MILEAGKTYKTRSGEEVKILLIEHSVKDQPAVGVLQREFYYWHLDGVFLTDKECESGLDIISEAITPNRVEFVGFVSKDNTGVLINNQNDRKILENFAYKKVRVILECAE